MITCGIYTQTISILCNFVTDLKAEFQNHKGSNKSNNVVEIVPIVLGNTQVLNPCLIKIRFVYACMYVWVYIGYIMSLNIMSLFLCGENHVDLHYYVFIIWVSVNMG